MIRTILYYAVSSMFLFSFACHRKTVAKEQEQVSSISNPWEKLEQLAKQEYQEGYKIIFNKPKTVALVLKAVKPQAQSIYHTVYFFLFEVVSQEKIHQDVLLNAEDVKWISSQEIAAISVPGQVEDPNVIDFRQGYIYNVMDRTKRSLK